MLTIRKLACLTLIITTLFGSLLFVNQTHATNVPSLITSDTTWTLAGSPYTLTGPTAVNKGVTLTIEAGVIVNLNNYYIQVNGTLIAVGKDSQHIILNSGTITFTVLSSGWNQQTGVGNRIEYAEMNQITITSYYGLKFNTNTIMGTITAGNDTTITSNKITGSLFIGYSSTINGNTISGTVQTSDKTTILNNVLSGSLTSASFCVINGNSIIGSTTSTPYGNSGSALNVGPSSVVSNNAITGTLTGSPSEVRGNSLEGGGSYYSPFSMDPYSVPAVTVSSTFCKFTANMIKGTAGEAIKALDASFVDNNIIGQVSASSKSTFQHNTITGTASGNSFSNNRIYGSISLTGFSPSATGNSIENGGIYCQTNQTLIKNNVITKGEIYNAAGAIQKNLITEGSGIITGSDPVIIQSNTISKNSVGITVGSGQATISSNNIEDCTQNSILLTTSANVTVINNWWGTTDEQSISNSIHDFKNDFNLGIANYKPILTERDSQAVPSQNNNLPSLTPITPEPSAVPTGNGSSLINSWELTLLEVLILWSVIIAIGLVIALVVIRHATRTSKN